MILLLRLWKGGDVEVDVATSLSIAAILVSLAGTVIIYRKTNVEHLVTKIEFLERENAKLEAECASLRSENRWLNRRLQRLEEAGNAGRYMYRAETDEEN